MTDGARLLGEFLRRNGLTQLAAGRAIGVSDPTIHDWVTGAKRPRAHHREAVAVWTSSEVPCDAWLTEQERVCAGTIRPFVAPSLESEGATGESATSATAKPTGTDGV